jgi:hypothetical protein
MFGLAVNPKREQNGDGGTDKIRKVAPEDLPEISSALSRAFFDDPLSARGGRLVMRLLAVTAEPTARDRALRPTRWWARSVWMERSVHRLHRPVLPIGLPDLRR